MVRKVRPIPEGYHSITPHLTVRNGSAAIEFYKTAFGAREVHRMPGPDGKSLMHAELQVGDSRFFLNDEFPAMGARSPQSIGGSPVTIHLYVEDADGFFTRATKAGAEVTMPLQNMFWGDRYGKLKDPFGHEWSVASHLEDLSPAEIQKRAASAFKS